ncbi:MAG: DNA-processing protein DprA [Lachnospiraceae bacterium]|nr:DNA-processing protein DprA [Lachnospiraceae bacterium]
MDTNERYYKMWLLRVPHIGNLKYRSLMEHFGFAGYVYKAEKNELMAVKGIGEKEALSIINNRNTDEIKRIVDKCYKDNINIVLSNELNYPNKLENIFNPPGILFYKGKLPDNSKPSIAVIGARSCSNYGKEIAYNFSRELSKRGIQVISGLAYGTDLYAHKGALDANEPTYGVLGCGVDICYPARNIETYMRMTDNGGVISEYFPGTKPAAANFPVRNRIISGLSDGILVVEARKKSGSLITADIGLEQGKDIFAIPGRINDELSYGCNNLIRFGAVPVSCISDIIEEYSRIFGEYFNGLKIEDNINNSLNFKNILESDEKIVYDLLRLEPLHIEEILTNCGFGLAKTIQILYKLECRNLIESSKGNYYSKRMIIDK